MEGNSEQTINFATEILKKLISSYNSYCFLSQCPHVWRSE